MSYYFKKSFLSGLMILISVVIIPALVFAQNSTSVEIKTPLKVQTLEQFIEIILGAIVQVGGIILVFGIIYTGFLFVKARGNATELTTAKEAFMWTIVGAGIILGAFTILKIVQATVAQLL